MNETIYEALILTLAIFGFVFNLFINQNKVKEFSLILIDRIAPWLAARIFLVLSAVFVILSPLAFSIDLVVKENTLAHAFAVFFLFTLLAGWAILLARFFYMDSKRG